MTSTDKYLRCTLMTAKGDIISRNAEAERLPVGDDGQTIMADSNETTGLKWADAPNIIQTQVFS